MTSSWLIPSASPLPALPILSATHGLPILAWGAPPSLLLPRNTPNCSLYETGCDGPRPHRGRPFKPKTNGGYAQRHRRKRKRKQKNLEMSFKNNLPQRIDRPLGSTNNIMKQQFSLNGHYNRTPDALRKSSSNVHLSSSAAPVYDTAFIAVLMPSPNSKYGKDLLHNILSDQCHEILKKSKSDQFLNGQRASNDLHLVSPGSNVSPPSSDDDDEEVSSSYENFTAGKKKPKNWRSNSALIGHPTVNTNTKYLTFINISEYHTPLTYNFPSPASGSSADGVRNLIQPRDTSKRFDLSSNNVRYFEGSDLLLQDDQTNLEGDTHENYLDLTMKETNSRIFRESKLSFAQRENSSGNKIFKPKKINLRNTMTEDDDIEVANRAQQQDYDVRSDTQDRMNYQEESQSDQIEYYDHGLQHHGRESSKGNNQDLESRQDYPDYSSRDLQIDQDDNIEQQFYEEQIQKPRQEQENKQINYIPEEQKLFYQGQDQQNKPKEKQPGDRKENEKMTVRTFPPTQFLTEEEEEELIRKEQITFPQKTQHGTVAFGKGKGKMKGGQKPKRGGEDDGEDGRKEWDRLGQLIIVVLLAALGTMGNTFAIAALVTEASLRKAGNILLANSMIASLLVTACVLPAGVVELLAGWSDPTPVCKPTWALTILAAHVALITLPCLAWENHARQHSTRPLPGCVLVAMILATWCAAFSLTAAQWAGGYGPTHCEERTQVSHDSVTACVGVPLVVIPILIMIIVHSHTLLRTPTTATTRLGDPERSSTEVSTISSKKKEPQKDLALVATNLAVGLITGSLWAGGVAIDWWGTSEGRLNWLPSVAAASCGFLYAAHRPFRDAYYQLFHYCCCKTTVSMARRGRNEPPIELCSGYNASTSRTTTEHVRVHIIPPYNMYSQQSPRQPQHSTAKASRPKERRHKPAKKEIYEL